MDVGPIGFGFAPRALLAAMAGIQHRLQHPVAHRRRQRPAQPRRRGALQAQRDGAARQAQRPRDLPVAGAALVLQAQNLSYATHRHSLGWHRSPRSSLADKQSAEHRPAVERLPPLLGVADFKSEWPRSNRNQWPTSFRNRRPTSPGICNSDEFNTLHGLLRHQASTLWEFLASEFELACAVEPGKGLDYLAARHSFSLSFETPKEIRPSKSLIDAVQLGKDKLAQEFRTF